MCGDGGDADVDEEIGVSDAAVDEDGLILGGEADLCGGVAVLDVELVEPAGGEASGAGADDVAELVGGEAAVERAVDDDLVVFDAAVFEELEEDVEDA
jgi:hypothetical protein